MKRRGDLNEKEKRFVMAFINQPNGTKAAIAAGYSAKTAKVQASRLLTRANVQAELERWRSQVGERTKIDAAYVLRQAVELYERCVQEIRPFRDRNGVHQTDKEGNGLFVFNAPGALRALQLIGKHASVRAFKDSPRHPGDRGLAISVRLQHFILNALKGDTEKRAEVGRDREDVN